METCSQNINYISTVKDAIKAFEENCPLPGENFDEWEARRTAWLVETVNAAGEASVVDSFVSGDLGYENYRNISDAKYPVSTLIANEFERKSEQTGISAVSQIKERLSKTYAEHTKSEICGYYVTIVVFILVCIVALTMLAGISGVLVFILAAIDVFALIYRWTLKQEKIERECAAAKRESLAALESAKSYKEWVKATKKIDKKYHTKTRIALDQDALDKFGGLFHAIDKAVNGSDHYRDIKTGKAVDSRDAARKASLAALENATSYEEWAKATKEIDKQYRTKTNVALEKTARRKFSTFGNSKIADLLDDGIEHDTRTGKII